MSANRLGFALASLLLGGCEVALYAWLPHHFPPVLWLGAGLIALGGFLFRSPRVTIYKVDDSASSTGGA